MDLLENDPRNPCIGCGPENPQGLRLVFHRTGDSVEAPFLAIDTMQGWPGRLHSGVLYTALLETANWTLYGLRGRVGLPVQTSALNARRWVATGENLRLVGRIEPGGTAEVRILSTALDAGSVPVASLTRDFDLPDRATFLKRMGYDEVPPGLEDVIPS